jgi:hypothetical protein
MKIYIATPVNARKEPTLEKKQIAAYERVEELTRMVKAHLPKANVCSVFSAIVVRKNGQPVSEDKIMGACVRKVMQCDVILMDDGWGDSHGCKVERFTAQEYGKEIWTLFDLEALKSKKL